MFSHKSELLRPVGLTVSFPGALFYVAFAKNIVSAYKTEKRLQVLIEGLITLPQHVN